MSVKGIRHKLKRAASSSALMCWWNKRLVKRKWCFSPLSPPLSHAHTRVAVIKRTCTHSFFKRRRVRTMLPPHLTDATVTDHRCSGGAACSRIYMQIFWLLTQGKYTIIMAFSTTVDCLSFHPTNWWKMFAERLCLVLPASRTSDTNVTSASLQTNTGGLCCFSPCSFVLFVFLTPVKKKNIDKMLCSFILRTIHCDIMHCRPSFSSSCIHFPMKYMNSLGFSFNKWLPVRQLPGPCFHFRLFVRLPEAAKSFTHSCHLLSASLQAFLYPIMKTAAA